MREDTRARLIKLGIDPENPVAVMKWSLEQLRSIQDDLDAYCEAPHRSNDEREAANRRYCEFCDETALQLATLPNDWGINVDIAPILDLFNFEVGTQDDAPKEMLARADTAWQLLFVAFEHGVGQKAVSERTKTDRKTDNEKKTSRKKLRPLTPEVQRAAKLLKARLKSDPSLKRSDFVRQFVQDNDGLSYDSIYRGLTDHRSLWDTNPDSSDKSSDN